MESIRVQFDGGTGLELDEVDIGVADSVVAFDVSGRIVGLDEPTLGQVAGRQWVPTEIVLEPRDDDPVNDEPDSTS